MAPYEDLLGKIHSNMDEAEMQKLGYERYEYVGNNQDSSDNYVSPAAFKSGHNVSKRSPVNPVGVIAFPTLKTLGIKTTALGVSMLPTVIFAPSGALFIKAGKLFKAAAATSLLPPPIGK